MFCLGNFWTALFSIYGKVTKYHLVYLPCCNISQKILFYCFRVDDLYNFLFLWVPHLYGELEDMDPKSRGYELVESDTEIWEDEAGEPGQGGKDERRPSEERELTELTRESWEVSAI